MRFGANFAQGVFWAAILLFVGSKSANARSYQVFEVRKNIPMHEGDPIYHDYYINAGAAEGLKQGALILVKRRLPVHNPYSDSNEDMYLPVAHIKLIHVQRNVSVGRIVKSYSAKENVLIDHFSILAGDLIDVISNGGESDEGTGSGGNKKNSGGSTGSTDEKNANPTSKAPKTAAAKDQSPPAPPVPAPAAAPKAVEDGSLYPKENSPIILSQ